MKKWAKILTCGLLCAVFLTGCATVGNVKNNNPELIYNGTSAVMVEGNLYYGNALASDLSNDGWSYSKSSKSTYLARINTNKLIENTDNGSAKGVEKVDDIVVGGHKNFMFVLGQNIYYATPNTQKGEDAEGNTGNYYNYTSVYRTKLNGDNKTKLYTTNAEVSTIEALKYENKYYIVMLSGERLLKIDLSNGKATELATGVKSVAMPKTFQKDKVGSTLAWNGQIYFTTDKSEEDETTLSGSVVKRIKVTAKKGEEEKLSYSNSTIAFVGRERDVVFYTQSNELYSADISASPAGFAGQLCYSTSSASDISAVVSTGADKNDTRVEGYVFMSGSSLCYVKNNGQNGRINLEGISSYSLMLVSGKLAYLSTSGGIYVADLSNLFAGGSENVAVKTLATSEGSKIQTGAYAFDKDYVYFYAKLESVEESDSDVDVCYMFRVRVDGTSENAQLLSKRV